MHTHSPPINPIYQSTVCRLLVYASRRLDLTDVRFPFLSVLEMIEFSFSKSFFKHQRREKAMPFCR